MSVPVIVESGSPFAPRKILATVGLTADDQLNGEIILDVSDYRIKSVQLGGTFAATVLTEESLDKKNWVESSSDTTPTLIPLNDYTRFVRVRVDSFTSGEVEVAIAGRT